MKKAEMFIGMLLFPMCLMGQPTNCSGVGLAACASALTPGQWAILDQVGDSSNWSGTFASSPTSPPNAAIPAGALVYGSKATYDQSRHRVFYMGGGHGVTDFSLEYKFLNYEISSDTWTRLTNPDWVSQLCYTTTPYTGTCTTAGYGNDHAYGLQAIDEAHHVYYHGYANTLWAFACDINQALLSNIGGSNCAGPNIGILSTDGYRGNFVYFPDRDSLIRDAGGSLYEYRPLSSSPTWTTIGAPPGGWNGGDGTVNCYSPTLQSIIFGGGSNNPGDNFHWWTMNSSGTITALDDSPTQIYVQNLDVAACDPVTGHVIVLQPNVRPPATATSVVFYELNPAASTGSQWINRTMDLGPAVPEMGYEEGTGLAGWVMSHVTPVSLPDYNVVMFLTKDVVYLYKHANPFTAKCAQSGVVACWNFDDSTDMLYSWAAADTPLNTYMTTTLGITTNYLVSPGQNYPGQGKVAVSSQPAGTTFSVPVIDTSVFADGTGSLKFVIPSRSFALPAGFYDTFDKAFHAMGVQQYCISPTCAAGATYYMQFKVRMDDAMLNNQWRASSMTMVGTCSTSGAGSTTLINSSGVPFTSSMAGREIYILSDVKGGGGTGWDWDKFYTINSVTDSTHVVLNASPSPSAAGVAGWCIVGGDSDTREWGGVLTTPSANSLVVNSPGAPYGTFTSTMVGKTFRVPLTSGGFVAGDYTVTAYHSPTEITVNTSPTPSVMGTAGYGQLFGNVVGGPKVFIVEGNAPYGFGAGSNETVMQNWGATGLATLYGLHGGEYPVPLYGSQRLKSNQWQEITIKETVMGTTSGTPPVSYQADSLAQMWVDGVLAVNWPTHTWYWGDGPDGTKVGPGQFEFTPYSTNKDPTQVHTDAHMWIDDLIISTQPIAMGSAPPDSPAFSSSGRMALRKR